MWELRAAGVPATVLVDGAAAITMPRKGIDAGHRRRRPHRAQRRHRQQDRHLRGRDLAAAHHGIPFYVAAPRSTFDFSLADGTAIPIEERAPGRSAHRPTADAVYNPAFDVTPGRLITAFITEYGMLRPPYDEAIADLETYPRRWSRCVAGAGRREVLRVPRSSAPKIGSWSSSRATRAVRRAAIDDRSSGCSGDDARPQPRNVRRHRTRDAGKVDGRLARRCRSWPSGAWWSCATAGRCARPRGASCGRSREAVPAGNTLVLEDLVAPVRKAKPEPFGSLAGRRALRIDTTPSPPARRRFVNETLARLGATAEPRVIAALAASDAPSWPRCAPISRSSRSGGRRSPSPSSKRKR